MLRRPYTVDARVHDGPDAPTVRLRWYRTNLPALPIDPPTVINSRDWDEEPWRELTVGEAPKPDADRSFNGQWTQPALLTGQHICHPEWLASGEPWPNSLPATEYAAGWIPLCCLEVTVCPFQECDQQQINGAPASQLKQYGVDAAGADTTTPVVQYTVADALGGSSPDIRGAMVEYFPTGTGGPAQFTSIDLADAAGAPLTHVEQFTADVDTWSQVVYDPDGVRLAIHTATVDASIGLEVVGGVAQLVVDNAEIPAAAIAGLGTAAYEDVGTSGATIPKNDTANIFDQKQTVAITDATTGAVTTALQVSHFTAGAVALGFGVGLQWSLSDVGGSGIAAAEIVQWADPLHATRRGRRDFYVYDSSGSWGAMRLEAPAAGDPSPRAGFLGAAAAVRQTGDAGAALVTFGLMSGTPTFAGANVTGNIAGNAATASALSPGATINGVTFTGAANITVPAAAGTLTGGTLAAGVTASSLASVGTLTGGATGAGFTVALGASTISGQLPTANLPGGNWIGVNSGETVCSSFSLTAASGTYEATGNTFSLAAAGTYLVVAQILGEVTPAAAGAHFLTAKFRNTTDSADVANSETRIVLSAQSGVLGSQTTIMTAIITVASGKNFELYAARNGTTFSVSQIISGTSGRSKIEWFRLY